MFLRKQLQNFNIFIHQMNQTWNSTMNHLLIIVDFYKSKNLKAALFGPQILEMHFVEIEFQFCFFRMSNAIFLEIVNDYFLLFPIGSSFLRVLGSFNCN